MRGTDAASRVGGAWRRTLRLALTVAGLAAAPAHGQPADAGAGAVQVFLTPEAGLAGAFPTARGFEVQALALTDGLRDRLADGDGSAFAGDSAAVYIARDSTGTVLGFAVIGEEIGKYRPITYLVAVDPHLRVSSVAILVYRESRGGEVRRQRFLRQYRGKGIADPIRINQDIVNITGATLSVRALNAGVRRSLRLVEAARGSAPAD